MGKVVFEAGKNWLYAESRDFIYHGQSTNGMEWAASEADYSYDRADIYFGPEDATAKAHVFVVQEKELWQKILNKTGCRDSGVAMEMQGDLFVLVSTNAGIEPGRVPHEVMHLRIWHKYGGKAPIWLDEGFAAYAGWSIAQAYATAHGRNLTRFLPPINPEKRFTVRQLTSATQYPEGNEELLVFSRQCNELVEAVARKLGDGRLGEFLDAVCGKGANWRRVLEKRFGYSDRDLRRLDVLVEQGKNMTPEH